jgi:hypothetical protein
LNYFGGLLLTATVLTAVIVSYTPPAFTAECHLRGRISISTKDGRVVFGNWVRVLLVTRRIAVEVPVGLDDLNQQQHYDRMISAHINFYKKVQQAMATPGYLLADTLTRPDGTFGFYNLNPGTYQVVVTFPAIIEGYKVAWQLPVRLLEGQTQWLELNSANMLLPTYRRD